MNTNQSNPFAPEPTAPMPLGPSAPAQQSGWPGPPPGGSPGPASASTPPPKRQPRFTREQLVAMSLAAAGGAVTLVGVVLLLVMAAKAGVLTPPVRVAGGAVLAGALACAAAWVRPRTGGRIGSVALLATAAAALFFDVVAATRIYVWVPLPAGLAAALVIGVLAGWQAVRWSERWLFQAIVLAVAGLGPALTGSAHGTLVGFLVVLQFVGMAPEILRRWDETALTRTVPAGLAMVVWFVGGHLPEHTMVLCGGSIALIGLVSAVGAGLSQGQVWCASAALVISWTPILIGLCWVSPVTGALVDVALVLAAAAAGAALRHGQSLVRIMTFVLLATAALEGMVIGAQGEWRALPFFAVALAAMTAHLRVPRPFVGYLAIGALTVGVLAQGLISSYGDLFYRSRSAHMPVSELLAGLALIAFALLTVAATQGRRLPLAYLQPMLFSAGFAMVLGVPMMLVRLACGDATAFFCLHLVITVFDMVLAAGVLMAGLTRPALRPTSIAMGLTLIGCAMLKLLVFDLHYMGAATKAFTFMTAGIVLLAAGTAYARTYTQMATAEKAASGETPEKSNTPREVSNGS